MRARPATVDDAAAIAGVYNEGIADRVATFETRFRSPEDVREAGNAKPESPKPPRKRLPAD